VTNLGLSLPISSHRLTHYQKTSIVKLKRKEFRLLSFQQVITILDLDKVNTEGSQNQFGIFRALITFGFDKIFAPNNGLCLEEIKMLKEIQYQRNSILE
jgi:hypothetical protein